jgi:TRAP-type C4-dicarboxylate transport system permease small subunit
MKYLIFFVEVTSSILQRVAGALLVFIMLLTCVDVVGNGFGHPILGVEEIISIMAAIMVAFVLPVAHKKKAHIGIDILYRRLSNRFRKWDDILVCFLSGVLFFLAGWQCFDYAKELKAAGEVTSTLQIPVYILLYGVSFGCWVLFFTIFVEFIMLVRMRKG